MRKINLKIRAAVCILMMILTVQVVAETHYVSPGQSIQKVIDHAKDGDEIEVSPGNYHEAIDFKGKAIRLYSSGGPEVTTIDANRIAGVYHVVQCVSGEDVNTILEGFTITGGNANGSSYYDNRGGGMYNDNYSSPTVTDCIFTGNKATTYGGGMSNDNDCHPTVNNCMFTGNETLINGGGMCNVISARPMVTNCTFSRNSASGGGGGMFQGRAVVYKCIFSDNLASSGGGIYCGDSTTVTNCIFSNNTATGSGGGLYCGDSTTVTNCIFSNNTATVSGGGIRNSIFSPIVSNCTFRGNVAERGGGTSNYDGNPTLANCILWGNMPDEIHDIVSTTTVKYSDVDGGWTGPGGNNIDADPRFVEVNNPDPNLWNLRLRPDSPCIDRGDSTALLTSLALVDLDGKFRCFDVFTIPNTGSGPLKFLDMGAYEYYCKDIAGDINCDGMVDFKDIAIVCNNWLAGTEQE